jgi:spore maturation protein CgeB
MRILYVAQRFDYGIVEHGLSFEHYNFYEPLARMGHDIDYFAIDVGERTLGREGMNQALYERVVATEPDLMFTCLYREELDAEVVSMISSSTPTVTFNWFCDDHWRFDDFSARWAPAFNWVSTTDLHAVEKYRQIGYHNVIKTQWAANIDRYRPSGRPLERDVAFVGQVYGDRPHLIRRLRDAGIDVETYGTGWAVRRRDEWLAQRAVISQLYGARRLARRRTKTRISQDQMVEVFGTTRINLNLTDASEGAQAQIKGRTFEVPACGGFLLTGRAHELESYYEPGKEIVLFDDIDDLLDKTKWYLSHDNERVAIAAAGHARTIDEHTYPHRFREIFQRIGLV